MADYDERTILLVEEEALIAMNEAAVLKKNGYKVIQAYSAKKAIECVDEAHIDLILMDIDLGKGKMDGTEAAEIILQNHEVPIVFCTNHTSREMVEKVKGITRYGYVLKNAGEFILLEAITMAFELFKAHMKIKRAEQRASAYLRAIPDMMFRIDQEGKILDYMASKDRFYYQNHERIIGNNVKNIIPLELVDLFLKKINWTLAYDSLQQFEYQIPIPGEGLIDWEARMVKVSENEVIAIVRDVTEQNRMRKELTEKQAIFDAFLEHCPQYVFFKDHEIRSIMLSRTYENMLGMPLEQILGKTMDELFPSDLAKSMIEDDKRILNEGKVITVEEELNGKCYTTTKFPIEINGKPMMLAGFTTDITEQKEKEKALKENELKFKAAFNQSFQFFSIVQPDGTIEEMNELTLQFNYRAPEALGNSIYNAPWWTEDAIRNMKKNMDRVLSGKSAADECTYFDQDKKECYAIRTFYPINDEQGNLQYIGIQGLDITERKQMEENLKRALAEKDLLMREMNHRIKNNLSTITSLINLKESSVNYAVDLSSIKSQVEAIRIVHDKLAVSKGIERINIVDYFRDLLDTLFETFSVFSVKTEQHIEVSTLPSKIAVPLGLIVNEIATNAVLHGFKIQGEARFTTELTEDPENNQYILKLANNGEPFPHEIDIENSDSIGLRLISALVQQIKGTLELKPNPSPEFTIRFPMEED